jgi:hypothetical protein
MVVSRKFFSAPEGALFTMLEGVDGRRDHGPDHKLKKIVIDSISLLCTLDEGRDSG